MDSLFLLGLILIIVFIFAVSRCSLNCPCDSEKFNDHPVLRRNRRYRYIVPRVDTQNGDVSYHATCKQDNGAQVCKCTQCDDGTQTCTSKTCPSYSATQKCCDSPSTCDGLGCTDDTGPCDYNQWCVSSHDQIGNGNDDHGMSSEEIWIIVTISVLVAIAAGVFFYFWMTTKHSG